MSKELLELSFTVAGTPVPKARPKARIMKTKAGAITASVYTPGKTVSYENRIAAAAQATMNGSPPTQQPLDVQLTIQLLPPASWSQKRQRESVAGDIAATKKPDMDNIVKSALDAMNGIVYRDDAQIVRLLVIKVYSSEPALKISVRETDARPAP
jgi:Holliday junction resolvase RusA-like endonuclease